VILTQAVDVATTRLSHFDFVKEEFPWAMVYEQTHNRAFATFHDDKGLEPFLPDARWEDFNVMHNVSMLEVLGQKHLLFSLRLFSCPLFPPVHFFLLSTFSLSTSSSLLTLFPSFVIALR